ncbi:MAG: 50S ribosomal protein L15 [Mycoplasma sp.]
MQLHELKYTKGSRNHKSKIVGRGHGSGMGKTSGRGQDGQKARKSGQVRLAFEGGQTPLYRRLPKVGFNNHNFANEYNVINLKDLIKFNEKVINLEFLVSKGVFQKNKLPLKIIGNSEIPTGITIQAHKFSKGAEEAILKAKSKAEVITK